MHVKRCPALCLSGLVVFFLLAGGQKTALGDEDLSQKTRNTSPSESREHVRGSGRKGRGGKTIRKAVYGLPGSCLSSWSSLCPTQFPPFWMALAVSSTAFFRSW